jgi:2-dehydro-3-deoxygluconokinase
VSVGFIGRVGDDGLGCAVLHRLRGEGVDIDHLAVDRESTTGVMFRELRDLGSAEVVYWRRASAGSRLSPSDVRAAAALFESSRWLHVTGITAALSSTAAAALDLAIERARSAGASVSLDINLRRRLWDEPAAREPLAAIAARCDVVLGSLDEIAVVAGAAGSLYEGASVDAEAAADALLALGPDTVVVKLGAEGAVSRTRRHGGTASVRGAAFGPIRVIDPVGAGDAFCAGFLHGLLTDGVARGLELGGAMAAVKQSVPGDAPVIGLEDLEPALAENPRMRR